MVCTNPCDDCKREGLPILFTRYSAGYSSRAEGLSTLDKFKPTGRLQAQPGGVPIKTARYGVRMLRAGYLYLRIERRGLLEWEGYAVHPHGYLHRFLVMKPEEAEAKIACERNTRQANNSLIWITDAKNVKSLWYAFHPDPIDPLHLKSEIEPNPAKYMQRFDVAGWLAGSTSQADSLQPAQLDKQVLEFAALSDEQVQTLGNEQCFGLMGMTPQERAWGNYEVEETDQQIIAVPDAAPVIIDDVRTVLITQPTYPKKHGPRLEGMRKFLQDNKGVVVACEDALGIAQELSLHQLTAAIPYVQWLKETDKQGYSNAWKDSAARSIQTIREAMEKKAITDYDDTTARMRDIDETMGGHYPGSDSQQPVKLRRPDGTYETITVQELNRRRQAELRKQVEERTAKHEDGVKRIGEDVGSNLSKHCDLKAVTDFNKVHQEQLDKRDECMNLIAEDLVHWLNADGLTGRALGLYSETAAPEKGDGNRCAGQLCTILLQLDNSPRGRAWYAALDTFTPHKRNLVWRMLSLNNRAISDELVSALKLVTDPLPPSEQAAAGAQDNARAQKAYAGMVTALGQMSKTLSAADKLEGKIDKLEDALKTAFGSGSTMLDRSKALYTIATDGKTNVASALMTAVLVRVKALSPLELEKRIARAQALILARGLGNQAIAHIKQLQEDALSPALLKQVKSIGRRAKRHILGGGADSAMQEMRATHVVCTLNALAILPALSRAYIKHDWRTSTELAGSVADLLGALKEARATFYEKAIYKQVPDVVYKTHKVGTAKVSERELLAMKAGAARYVAAGMAVGVFWDALDGAVAVKEQNRRLATAYFARSIFGAASVGTTLAGASYLRAPLWLVRFNLASAIVTVGLTFSIAKYKGKDLDNWLEAQPFHLPGSKKIKYKSEAEMMGKLVDVLIEVCE
ncbi:conserved hypothethical protein (plasmid) [Ralstonia solanacearum CMR15]|nr:conserved hypothethical protein [Ralstonia solanacearum CMR15]